jgi:two-component system sensor histidine kinase KdpD
MKGAWEADRSLSRTSIGLALVALATVVCLRIPGINTTTAGFVYLIVVLGVAARSGFKESLIVSVTADLTFNFFFFHPVGTFTVADPQNWIALAAFLLTAIVASHLSARVRRQSAEAWERQSEMERLYAFSRRILLMDAAKAVAPQVAQQIAQSFDVSAVALYIVASGQVFRGGDGELPGLEPLLKQVTGEGAPATDHDRQVTIVPIVLSGNTIGSLGLQRPALPHGALQALVNLIAIALERERSAETAAKAEVERQSQKFKSTLLDAVTHEFKTPLTSIKAAATSLLGASPPLTGLMRELAEIVDEEADRLTRLVTEAVQIARIEAGHIQISKKPVALDAFVTKILARFQSNCGERPIRVNFGGTPPAVEIDANLVGLALGQLIDNALKYSRSNAPIDIRCVPRNEMVEIHVHDAGPGVPVDQRERIFDRYYRPSMSPSEASGSGLGLYVAREIVRAHGGDLWLEENTGPGTEFCMSFVAHNQGEGAAVAS